MKRFLTQVIKPSAVLLLSACCLHLAGCASAPSTENRMTCAKARDAGFFTVMFAAVGITFRVSEADAKAICDETSEAAAQEKAAAAARDQSPAAAKPVASAVTGKRQTQ